MTGNRIIKPKFGGLQDFRTCREDPRRLRPAQSAPRSKRKSNLGNYDQKIAAKRVPTDSAASLAADPDECAQPRGPVPVLVVLPGKGHLPPLTAPGLEHLDASAPSRFLAVVD